MALKNPPRFARTAQRNRLGVAIAAALALPASALAQEALEEIVVTARFREENLQQTPLAITAFTGDILEARGATSTLDLDAFVPNAVIAPLGAGWGSTAAAFIRGIGLGDNSLSFEPGVPIYIDDVYHGRPQGAVLDLLDIERVEVLRGPQGTLFGKNTLGGAVRIISRKPEGDGTGFIDVGAGSRDRLNLRGSYDFPLAEDKVFARVSASSKTQDGYFDILDYECVNGAGSLGLGGPGIAAGTNGVAQPAGAARSAESRVDLVRREYPPRDRRRAARQRARHHRRARLRRRPLRQRGRAVGPRRGSLPRVRYRRGQRHRRLDLQRPAGPARQVHRAAAHRRNGVPAGVASGRSTTGTTTSRSRCSVPAGSSTGVSKRRTSTRATTASAKTR